MMIHVEDTTQIVKSDARTSCWSQVFFSILNISTVTKNQQSPGIYKYWYAWEKQLRTKKEKMSSDIIHVVKIT